MTDLSWQCHQMSSGLWTGCMHKSPSAGTVKATSWIGEREEDMLVLHFCCEGGPLARRRSESPPLDSVSSSIPSASSASMEKTFPVFQPEGSSLYPVLDLLAFEDRPNRFELKNLGLGLGLDDAVSSAGFANSSLAKLSLSGSTSSPPPRAESTGDEGGMKEPTPPAVFLLRTYRKPTGIRTAKTMDAKRAKLRQEMRWKSSGEVIWSSPPPIAVWMMVTPIIPKNVLIQNGTSPMRK